MKPRAILLAGAFAVALAAASAGSFFWGEHVKGEEERSEFLKAVSTDLAIKVQVAAMTRAGAVDQAMHRADGFIRGDVLTIALFTGPDQPPPTPHQLAVLRLAAQYRDLYPASFEQANPVDSSIKARIDQALDLGAQSGATEYQWFAARYLNPADPRSVTASPPSSSP